LLAKKLLERCSEVSTDTVQDSHVVCYAKVD
jgi:hypothetical protein